MIKDTELTFPVPREILLNANQPIHYTVKGQRVLALRSMSCNLAKSLKVPQYPKCEVIVQVSPPTRRRLDPPNLYPTVKPLVDGLTDAGVWVDDDWQHLIKMSFVYGGPSKISGVFIIKLTIKEVK